MAELSIPSLLSKPGYPWKFYRAGGLDQVTLELGDDLLNLGSLDQKLWVALSCPTTGLEIDSRTLQLLDTDKDGRIRVPEILAAIRWLAPRLKDLRLLLKGDAVLPLTAIQDQTPEGKAIVASARQILANLGKEKETSIAVADVADLAKIFAQTKFNGDGVVTVASADDEETRLLIQDIIACLGPEADRSGQLGVNKDKVDAFYAECAALVGWSAKGEDPAVKTLGAATPAALEAVRAVRTKVDDFFTRCKLAAFDARASSQLNRAEADFAALAAKDLSLAAPEIASFPIARVEAGRALPLRGAVNPAWAGPLDALHKSAVTPLFGEGKDSLSEEEWSKLKAAVGPLECWLAGKVGAKVEKLGLPRVQAIAAGQGKATLDALLAKDKALEPEAQAVKDVGQLLSYNRDLGVLLRNFVSFADFYDPRVPAIFQVGTLFLDSRSCDLCIKVSDPGAHSAMAGLSKVYVAYCDLKRPGGETMKIAACFTQGDSDYLMVGRNGIFYDRQGRDWDATIIKIVDNPISIRQAFWAPYKKFIRMVEDQIAKFAAAKEKAAEGQLAASATQVTATATAGKPAPAPPPADVGKMVGIVAALGVGVGALGTMFGGFVTGFINLQPWWSKPLAVLGIILVISGPSMLIAWLKLRQRTLGPILDANGWAVNGRVRINIPLGTALTNRAVLPPGASRTLEDPYEDKEAKKRKKLFSAGLVVVLLALGVARYCEVWPFCKSAPASQEPAKTAEKAVLSTNAPSAQ
jgi:hypothetical protein